MRACLNLMKWNDNCLEENNVFISKWNGKTGNDRCKDIQKLGGTVEFVGLMDEKEERFINSLSYHLSSWNKFSIEFMKNVFEIVSLH